MLSGLGGYYTSTLRYSGGKGRRTRHARKRQQGAYPIITPFQSTCSVMSSLKEASRRWHFTNTNNNRDREKWRRPGFIIILEDGVLNLAHVWLFAHTLYFRALPNELDLAICRVAAITRMVAGHELGQNTPSQVCTKEVHGMSSYHLCPTYVDKNLVAFSQYQAGFLLIGVYKWRIKVTRFRSRQTRDSRLLVKVCPTSWSQTAADTPFSPASQTPP